MKNEKNYESPEVEVLEVKVEQGFATSVQSGDWMHDEWGSDVEFN